MIASSVAVTELRRIRALETVTSDSETTFMEKNRVSWLAFFSMLPGYMRPEDSV